MLQSEIPLSLSAAQRKRQRKATVRQRSSDRFVVEQVVMKAAAEDCAPSPPVANGCRRFCVLFCRDKCCGPAARAATDRETNKHTQNMGGPPATGGEGASGGELAGASFLFGYFLWTSKENSHAAAGRGFHSAVPAAKYGRSNEMMTTFHSH